MTRFFAADSSLSLRKRWVGLILVSALVLAGGLALGSLAAAPSPAVAMPADSVPQHHQCDDCKYYTSLAHLPAEERDAQGNFVGELQWREVSFPSFVPVEFSVEYCIGQDRTGNCA